MITRKNLKVVLSLLSDKDKKRVLNSEKEYVVLYLHVFNIGSYTTVRLTNDYERYMNISDSGNAILCTQDVQDLLNDMI